MKRLSKPSLEPAHDPLRAYKSKRDFALTPEPAAGGQSGADQLTFVVHKHWASSHSTLPEPLALQLIQMLIVVTLSILMHGIRVKPLMAAVWRRT